MLSKFGRSFYYKRERIQHALGSRKTSVAIFYSPTGFNQFVWEILSFTFRWLNMVLSVSANY
jgi:hypothetical protein